MAKYAVGDRVNQPQYGAGTITSVDDSRTVIEFDEHGTRMFATSIEQPPMGGSWRMNAAMLP